MGLEATFLILDNSEWMRNGDYAPSRLEAQQDAVNRIIRTKLQANPESVVGLMTAAGKPDMLLSLSSHREKLIAALNAVKFTPGQVSVFDAIQVAQLAMKHRQNKNLQQRVIFFVGSPIADSSKASQAEAPAADILEQYTKFGKSLKKNNIAVDIVHIPGNPELPAAKHDAALLEALVNGTNNQDNCVMIQVPAGPNSISESILQSAIMGDAQGGSGAGGSHAMDLGDFDFDPSLDPELAMALKMSLEEEQARTSRPSDGAPAPSEDKQEMGLDMDDEDEEIARAIALSMEEDQKGNSGK